MYEKVEKNKKKLGSFLTDDSLLNCKSTRRRAQAFLFITGGLDDCS